jgi:L-lysine 6-transaminase
MKKPIAYEDIHPTVTGGPLALQDDWWTSFAPVFESDKTRGSRLHVYDHLARDPEKKYRTVLDFCAFFATSPLGYNHPGLQDEEYREKLAFVAQNKPSNSDFWTPELAEFVKTFHEIAGLDYLPHLFIVSGGALAVENALKAAFDWKVRWNLRREGIDPDEAASRNDKRGEELGLMSKVLHFKEAFHGRSGYTLSLTNTADPRKICFFPKFDWCRVSNPKIGSHDDPDWEKKVIESEDEAIRQIEQHLDTHRYHIAAMIIEPIQGEGGDNHFRDEFFVRLREICDREDDPILLIYDEVQTGFGATGKMWAHEHFGPKARPDLVAFGKKFQTCGVLAGPRFDEIKSNVFSNLNDGKSRLNSTWGGNLVDMVRCTRYLEIVRDENLVDHAAKMGEYFIDQLRQTAAEHGAGIITNVRGRGLFIAFDVTDVEKPGDRRGVLWQKMREDGVLTLFSGRRGIRFRPHLDVTKDEIDDCMKILAGSLQKVVGQGVHV